MEIISRKEAKERGLKRYFTRKPCKHEHVAERLVSTGACCECKVEYRKQNTDYFKEYRKQNTDKITKWRKEYKQKNKDKISEYQREYKQKNKEKIAEQKKEYRKKNKDKISEREKEYRKKNPVPKFIRRTLDRILTNWKGGRKKVEKLNGYTYEQLVTRIEFQFKDGMSWENRSEWHIDHIKPIKAFLDEGITDPKIINALDNLQPLWAKDNLSKGTKYNG